MMSTQSDTAKQDGPGVALRKAATLILMRERDSGPPEVLMIERSAEMVFAAGAIVFPGGAIDEGDHAIASAFEQPSDMEDMAARVAAIRETIEESGVAIGLVPTPSPEQVHDIRDGLKADLAFEELLARHGLQIQPDMLTPFARWIPPEDVRKRRYDTRFFVAAATFDMEAIADGSESVHAFWAPVDQILADRDVGKYKVIFPTLLNLKRLAQYSSAAEAAASGALYGHLITNPQVEEIEGEQWLCVSPETGYPMTRVSIEDLARG